METPHLPTNIQPCTKSHMLCAHSEAAHVRSDALLLLQSHPLHALRTNLKHWKEPRSHKVIARPAVQNKLSEQRRVRLLFRTNCVHVTRDLRGAEWTFYRQMELITHLQEEDSTMQIMSCWCHNISFVLFSFGGDNFLTKHPISNLFSYLCSLWFYLWNKTHFPYISK